MNNNKPKCQVCKGSGSVCMTCMNHGTKEKEKHTVNCPGCNGKGYLNEDDRTACSSVEQFYQIVS